MAKRENKAVVRSYIAEILNKCDLDNVDAYVSHDGFKERIALFLRAFPDLNVEIEDELADKDKVAIRFTGRATHQGGYHGRPASGKPVELSGTAIYRIEDGRIAEAWVNWDTLGIMEQIGGFAQPTL
jgi:steroid delta-isomerase-like uncharacterized protein